MVSREFLLEAVYASIPQIQQTLAFNDPVSLLDASASFMTERKWMISNQIGQLASGMLAAHRIVGEGSRGLYRQPMFACPLEDLTFLVYANANIFFPILRIRSLVLDLEAAVNEKNIIQGGGARSLFEERYFFWTFTSVALMAFGSAHTVQFSKKILRNFQINQRRDTVFLTAQAGAMFYLSSTIQNYVLDNLLEAAATCSS